MRTEIAGVAETSADGERYIAAEMVMQAGFGSVAPLGMQNSDLGGGREAFQEGTLGGYGLNNIGLLVRSWGRVTQKGHDDGRNEDYLYVDDGCTLRDGTVTGSEENIGVRVIYDPSPYNTGDFLEVTGISSCFKTPSDAIARRTLTRRASDIRKLSP